MKLIYNGFAIHDIGEFTVSQSRLIEEGQRTRVSLKVGVTTFERSYGDNYALVRGLREALRTQQGVLQWTNTDTGQDYLNQTVTLESEDLPEEWGTYSQTVHLVFHYYEQNLVTNNLPLTWSGTGATIVLGTVVKFGESYTTERFSPWHSHRSSVKGELSVSGMLLADATQGLAARRAALAAARTALLGLNSLDGRLQFGSGGSVFDRVVRVEKLTATIDQLYNDIAWSFTASYTVFPIEATFATVDYEAAMRDANTGEQFLAVTGKIASATEAIARAKLAVLLPAVLAQNGYAVGAQQLRLDSTVRSVSANEDGDTFTELSFSTEYRRWRSDNQKATFRKTGATTAAVSFGNVLKWDYQYNARRFSDQRSQRQHAGGVIAASGTWSGDAAQTLAVRRAALLAQQRAMVSEVNNADGTLVYGDFSQVVRVSDLKAEVNQAVTAIDWSFSASYSLFPDESGYATVEMSVVGRANVEDGEETLGFTGRIFAPDESLARAKLGTLRNTVLSQYGYSLAQQLKADATVASVFANGDRTAGYAAHELADGTTFTELSFTEEYRRRLANLVGYGLSVATRDDVSSGQVLTTMSGHVVAGGPSADAAYATAVAKAVSLGSGKEALCGDGAFQRSSDITWERRQTQASNVVEFVRLTFNYTYQGKMAAGRVYLELSTEVTADSFGNDAEAVNGSLIAATAAEAETVYQDQVRSLYAGRMIHAERKHHAEVRSQVAGGGFTAQATRMEFSFSALVVKATGSIAYRYGISISSDVLRLTKESQVSGSVYAVNETAAALAVNVLLATLSLGQSVRSDRKVDREYTSDSASDLFMKYDFTESFVAKLAGVTGLLEMSVSETVKYSSIRWVVQPVPRQPDGSGGVSIPQDGGINEGTRSVRGSVTAVDLGTAENWAKKQRTLLTGDANGNHFATAEEWERGYDLLPRVDGVVKGTGINVKLYKVGFSFGEILPSYPAP
jgi:hypothetical protein